MADGLLTSLARFVRTLGQGRTFDSLNGMTQGRKLATRTSASSPPGVESALDDCGSLYGKERAVRAAVRSCKTTEARSRGLHCRGIGRPKSSA